MTVPKTSKSEQTRASKSRSPGDAATTETAGTEVTAAETKKPAKRASGAKPAAKKAAAKKTRAALTKKPAKRTSSAAPAAVEPSDSDIRLRAYFIAERRVQLALQGDPALDWIEAREQLLNEAPKSGSKED